MAQLLMDALKTRSIRDLLANALRIDRRTQYVT